MIRAQTRVKPDFTLWHSFFGFRDVKRYPVMLEPARISLPKVRKSIIVWGALSCLAYIVFLFIMKAAGLLHITGLRMVNYVLLFFVCFIGIKRWVTRSEHYVPFLTVFTTALLTGAVSFVLFSIFLSLYSQFDTELNSLFRENAPETLRGIPAAVVLFEGVAVSIITAFINMQYFRRYEEGEVSPEKKHSVDKP